MDKPHSQPEKSYDEVKEAAEIRTELLVEALRDPDKAAVLLEIATRISEKIEAGDPVDPEQRLDYNVINDILPMEGVYNGLSLEDAIAAWKDSPERQSRRT